MDPLILVPIIIALAPGSIALVVVSRNRVEYWINAILGGSGWFIALLARLPLLSLIQGFSLAYRVFSASLAAGVFEETIRFLIVRYRVFRSPSLYSIVSIGLGWGLAEALIIYALQVPFAAAIHGYSWVDFLPGAVERDISILFHLAMTMLISLAMVKPVKLLLPATMSMHTLLNIAAVYALVYIGDPWIVEGLIGLLTIAVASPIIIYVRKLLPKNLG